MENDDPAVDVELARAHAWWEAELAEIIASGFPAETAAQAMVGVGACYLANNVGAREASDYLEAFRRGFDKAVKARG